MLKQMMISWVFILGLGFPVFGQPVDLGVGSLPDGLIEAHGNAQYGAYYSRLTPRARALQEKILDLENKIYGIGEISEKSILEQARVIYGLENAIFSTHLEVINNGDKLPAFDQQALEYLSVRVYREVRFQSERIYENMIRFIDVAIPGPNGLQTRRALPGGKAESIYWANYRSDKKMTAQERKEAYEQKVASFLAEGGSLSEILLLNQVQYDKMGAVSRYEYVELADGRIFVTEGKAGHVLLAQGKTVKSAGQLVFVKNPKGQFSLAIVTNASGNYKPDLLSAELVAKRLSQETGLDSSRVVVTKGEPLSTQSVKILMKGMNFPKDQIKTEASGLETASSLLINKALHGRSGHATTVKCSVIFQ